MDDHMEMTTTYKLGSMDLTFFDDQDMLGYLSVDERKICESFMSKTRQKRWTAGRILSKYLILNRQGGKDVLSTDLVEIGASSFGVFSGWMYRQLELLPSDNNRGYSTVSWNGKDTAYDVSISHNERKVYCAIANGQKVGLDVEKLEKKLPSFYRGNYTSEEKAFTCHLSEYRAIPEVWTYTLLWTMKEAILKSFNSNNISVWDFPNLNVAIDADLQELRELYDSGNSRCSKGLNISYSLGQQDHINTRAIAMSYPTKILSIVYN